MDERDGEREEGREKGKICDPTDRGGRGRVVAEAPAEVIIIHHYPVPANHCNPYFILCRFFVAGREERLRAPEIIGKLR